MPCSSREAAWYKYVKILFQLINTNAKNTLLKITCISLGGHKQPHLRAELHCAQKKKIKKNGAKPTSNLVAKGMGSAAGY